MMKKLSFILKTLLIVAWVSVSPVVAQSLNVTGVVKDDTGAPLIGASVVVQGTTIGAATSVDGSYILQVPDGSTKLLFSYIGFDSQEVEIGSRSVIDVVMTSENVALNEVVVIGYGSQRKRDVTGAITSISQEAIMEKQAVNVFDALQGAAPGVMVISDSAAPGEDSSTVKIRGTSTIEGGTAPLYIVDGVPQDDISNINPGDIKSMEVLKDAASAAIYGSRSANGVIIITTSSGEEGDPRVDLRFLQSFSTMSHKISQANADDRRALDAVNSGYDSFVSTSSDSLAYNRTGNDNYQDILTQLARRSQVDLSVSGGTKKFKYMSSMGYLDETGIIINSDSKRFTGRTNATFQATDKLQLVSRFSYSYQKANTISAGSTFYNAFRRPAYYVGTYPDGSYLYVNSSMSNPYTSLISKVAEQRVYTGTIYQGLVYNIIPGLTFNANVNGTFKLTRKDTLTPDYVTTSDPQVGSATTNMTFNQMVMAESFMSYNKDINASHSINALLGITGQNWLTEGSYFAGSDLISNNIFTSNNYKETLTTSTTSASSHSLIGMFARVGYSYEGRYLVNATIRRDGSSRFTNNRWGYFPSLSLGWRFSDEKFMEWAKPLLSDAKLRASYGVTGNQEIDNYESTTTYEFGSYYYQGETGVTTAETLGNPDLKWETTTQLNYGIDLSFMQGRFSLSADYYNKVTDDLLYSAKVPSELGYETMKMNLGSIQNKGFEIMVSGYPIKKKDFQWQTAVTYSYNQNMVTDLSLDDYVVDNAWIVAEGQPLGQFYGYNALGVYEYDESNAYRITTDSSGNITYHEQLTPVFERDSEGNVKVSSSGEVNLLGYLNPDGTVYEGNRSTIGQMTVGDTTLGGGDRIWEDLDGNGVIDDSDRKILGNGIPVWTMSWSNTFRYKNLSLSMTFYGSFGNDIYNEMKYQMSSYSTSSVTPTADVIYNAWKWPGQVTIWPTSGDSVSNSTRELTSTFIEDGSYIRLQNIRLTYSFNPELTKKLGLGGVMVYIYGNNLVTWTNYTGYDPEFTSGTLTPGYDNGRYPRTREMGLGVNLNF